MRGYAIILYLVTGGSTRDTVFFYAVADRKRNVFSIAEFAWMTAPPMLQFFGKSMTSNASGEELVAK